jgi:hypothetical protein
MRAVLLLPLLFILSACAANIQVGDPARDPTPTIIGEGTNPGSAIVVYRASETGFLANVATNPALFLGERLMGTCRIGAPLVIRLAPGDYVVGAITQAGQAREAVSVLEGQTLYVRCGTTATPSLAPPPFLDPVDASTGARQSGVRG